MKNLIAVICCEYKRYSLLECLETINIYSDWDVLLNWEGTPSSHDILTWQNACPRINIQWWSANGDGWDKPREYDQQQDYRLSRICVARNMVMDYASANNYDNLYFTDSDVILNNSFSLIEKHLGGGYLLSGLIGGRGVHKGARYFGSHRELVIGSLYKVDYATMGSLLIPKAIFMRFRCLWGWPFESEITASEDPIFGENTRRLGYKWYVDTEIQFDHLGNLDNNAVSQF